MVELIKIGKVNGLENFYDYSHLGQIDYLLQFISQIRLSISRKAFLLRLEHLNVFH